MRCRARPDQREREIIKNGPRGTPFEGIIILSSSTGELSRSEWAELRASHTDLWREQPTWHPVCAQDYQNDGGFLWLARTGDPIALPEPRQLFPVPQF